MRTLHVTFSVWMILHAPLWLNRALNRIGVVQGDFPDKCERCGRYPDTCMCDGDRAPF